MDSSINEHRIIVPKTARYYSIGDLQNSDYVWIVLHGYGQLAKYFIRKFQDLHSIFKDVIIAPDALNKYYLNDVGRVGATWMTKEDRETEIADYVNYLNQLSNEFDLNNKKLIVLGFSQGGATLCRWITDGKVKPDHTLLWAAFFPPDLQMNDSLGFLKQSDLHVFYGNQDELIGESQMQHYRELKEKYQLQPKEHVYEGKHEIIIDELIRFRAQL